jgi:ATP-binding cassette subfamily B protein
VVEASILASRFLSEIAANMIVVKTFDCWPTIRDRYDGEQHLLLRKWTAYFKQSVKFDLIRTALFFILLTACLLKSLRDIEKGTFNIGHFVLINAYIIQICTPIEIMLKAFTEATEALTGFSQFFQFIRANNSIKLTKENKEIKSTGTINVELRDVAFGYNNQKPILINASLFVSGGQILALTGRTGSGKSTIVKLLLGLESPMAGKVLINGLNIASYSDAELYSLVTFVPQETYVFNDTLAFNLRIAKPNASDAELEKAAETAQLNDLIRKLPCGINSPVGDRGLMLSGGERQRVAFARAILRGAPIIILDEGTSALDEATERKIIEALRPMSKDRIVIMVAHRRTAIAAADEVCLVEDGKTSISALAPTKG